MPPIERLETDEPWKYALWLQYELRTNFKEKAIMSASEAAQALGIHEDNKAALENSGVLTLLGPPQSQSVREYSRFEIIVLRAQPALLAKIVKTYKHTIAAKNAKAKEERERKKKKLSGPF